MSKKRKVKKQIQQSVAVKTRFYVWSSEKDHIKDILESFSPFETMDLTDLESMNEVTDHVLSVLAQSRERYHNLQSQSNFQVKRLYKSLGRCIFRMNLRMRLNRQSIGSSKRSNNE